MRWARVPLAALGLFLALGTALWVHRIQIDHPEPRYVLLSGDAFRYFYPSTVFLHRELRAGRLPTWNPYQLAGQPYLALHVPAVLYPPHLLLAWALPPLRALEAGAVLHFALAGFFTWLFAGRIGLRGAPRLAAGVVYMLSGPLLLGIYMPPFVSAPAWLPAIAWSLHGLLSERRVIWSVALALCTSMAFLAGHSQAFVYEMEFAALYGAFGLFAVARGREMPRTLGLAALAVALLLLLTAAQLLPTLELTRDAIRGLGGLPYAEIARSTVRPTDLLAGLLRPFGSALVPPQRADKVTLVALPILTLPLVACGLAVKERRAHVVAFGLLAVVLALLMLGMRGFLFRLYFALPLGNVFRNPGRMAFLYLFLVSVLVGAGIDGVGQLLRRSPRTQAAAGAVTAALLILVAGDSYLRTRLTDSHPFLLDPGPGTAPPLIRYLAARWRLGRAFIEKVPVYDLRSLYKTGMMNEIFVVPDYEPTMPADYQRYFAIPQWPRWHGALYVDRKYPRRPRPEAMGRLLDLMSVRYYAINRDQGREVTEAVREFAGGPVTRLGWMNVTERTSAVPRVYAVRRAVRVANFEAAMWKIRGASFDPQGEAVVVDPAARHLRVRTWPAGGGEDSASFASYEPERVEIDATCPKGCLLVLTDLYYPGWSVRVDGAERTIERVNGIFRGVELEPGSHRVSYVFAPLSFRIGAALGAGGLLACAGIAAGASRRRRGP